MRYETALVNDGNVAAEAFDDFQNVRSQKNRRATFGHAAKQRFQSAGRERVHPFERLIEEQDARPVDDGSSKRKFLLHAMRIVRDHGLGPVGELHEFQQLL